MDALNLSDARQMLALLEALNGAPAHLASGAAAFVLATGKWVYIDWDPKTEQHVLVNPD